MDVEQQLSGANIPDVYGCHGHTVAPRQCQLMVGSNFGHPKMAFGQLRVKLRNYKKLKIRAERPLVANSAEIDRVHQKNAWRLCLIACSMGLCMLRIKNESARHVPWHMCAMPP